MGGKMVAAIVFYLGLSLVQCYTYDQQVKPTKNTYDFNYKQPMHVATVSKAYSVDDNQSFQPKDSNPTYQAGDNYANNHPHYQAGDNYANQAYQTDDNYATSNPAYQTSDNFAYTSGDHKPYPVIKNLASFFNTGDKAFTVEGSYPVEDNFANGVKYTGTGDNQNLHSAAPLSDLQLEPSATTYQAFPLPQLQFHASDASPGYAGHYSTYTNGDNIKDIDSQEEVVKEYTQDPDFQNEKDFLDTTGYKQYDSSSSFNKDGPHQIETIKSKSFHRDVAPYSLHEFDHEHKHKEEEEHAEVHYHQHKHLHKHNHKQEHVHKHKQEHVHKHGHKHEQKAEHQHKHMNHHKHEHEQHHKHQHHNEHKHQHDAHHKHEHHSEHKHEHKAHNEHKHDHHHGHKHSHHNEHKHDHHNEHKHDHHHGHKHQEDHKHEHKEHAHHNHHHGHKHESKHQHKDEHKHHHKHKHSKHHH